MWFRFVIPKLKYKYVVSFTLLLIFVKIFGILVHIFEQDFFTDFAYPYDGDVVSLVRQLRHNQTPNIPPINFYNYSFIHPCKSKCETSDNLTPIRLVYLVKSAEPHFERRKAIRQTWGFERRFSDVEIRTVFIVGTSGDHSLSLKINDESKKYNDIVQANFIDSYFNNTIKTIMAFKWAVTFCSNSKFYMFVDDDYYVSTKNVLSYIRNPTNYPRFFIDQESKKLENRRLDTTTYEMPDDVNFYSGYVFFSSPHRHLTSKWYVSLEEYPFHMWPPYVTAGAYILSKEALLNMYYANFYVKHFRFDDVYLGLLAKKVGIEPFHSDYFNFHKYPYNMKSYRFTVASHGYTSVDELLKVWNEQKSLGNA